MKHIPLVLAIFAASCLPGIAINAVQLSTGQILNDTPAENAIHFCCYLIVSLFCVRAYFATFGCCILGLLPPTMLGIFQGNDLYFIAKDCALFVQYLLVLMIYANVFRSVHWEKIRLAFLIASFIQVIQVAAFSIFLETKTLSIDLLLLLLTPFCFAGPLRAVAIIAFAAYAYFLLGTIGFAFLSIALFMALTLGIVLYQAGPKISLPLPTLVLAAVVGICIFSALNLFIFRLDSFLAIGEAFTSKKSLEIRFNELRGLSNRDPLEAVLGGGFGYANDHWEFRQYKEFSSEARLRVFHFGAAWWLAKLGQIGIAVFSLCCGFLIVRMCSMMREPVLWVYFSSGVIGLTLLGSNITFGLTMKSCVAPLAAWIAIWGWRRSREASARSDLTSVIAT